MDHFQRMRVSGAGYRPPKPQLQIASVNQSPCGSAYPHLANSGRTRMSSASTKIVLFIDGPNLYATAKTLGFDIDYKRLLSEFQGRGALLRAFYYTAIIEDQEFSSIRPLVDWLDYNGYTVVTKAIKEYVDASGRRKAKGDMRVELAIDAMELAAQIDEMMLFSGDGDFPHTGVHQGWAFFVRTVGGLSACADAGLIEPRLDVAALPDSAAGVLGVALSAIISDLGVLGPIQR